VGAALRAAVFGDRASFREFLGGELANPLPRSGARSPCRSSRESTNKPLRRWFRRLVRRTLAAAHRGYPIERVEVTVTESDEFYVGVGD
jgi:hypothetical protein